MTVPRQLPHPDQLNDGSTIRALILQKPDLLSTNSRPLYYAALVDLTTGLARSKRPEGIMIRQALFLAAVFLLIGCADLGSDIGPVVPGSYRYAAYDTSGTLVVQGWFSLVIRDSASITGEWHFTAAGSPKNIGPQIGDGQLVAAIQGGSIWIELQPQYRDNNLMLTARLGSRDLSGTWQWSTFIGPTAAGTFTAKKI
jgi:hypothetical protein